jgi:hypothetical protein
MDTLTKVFEAYKGHMATMVAVIVLDVIFGVSSALKSGKFDWTKLADFYKSTVVPGLLGWVGITAATYVITPGLLGTTPHW